MGLIDFRVKKPNSDNITELKITSEGIILIFYKISGVNNLQRVNIKNEKKLMEIFGTKKGIEVIANARQFLATKGVLI